MDCSQTRASIRACGSTSVQFDRVRCHRETGRDDDRQGPKKVPSLTSSSSPKSCLCLPTRNQANEGRWKAGFGLFGGIRVPLESHGNRAERVEPGPSQPTWGGAQRPLSRPSIPPSLLWGWIVCGGFCDRHQWDTGSGLVVAASRSLKSGSPACLRRVSDDLRCKRRKTNLRKKPMLESWIGFPEFDVALPPSYGLNRNVFIHLSFSVCIMYRAIHSEMEGPQPLTSICTSCWFHPASSKPL